MESLIANEKIDYLIKFLDKGLCNEVPDHLMERLGGGSFGLFLEQLIELLPCESQDPFIPNKGSESFVFSFWQCIERGFQNTDIKTVPWDQTKKCIALMQKAQKAVLEAKQISKENIFLPITSIGELDEVESYWIEFESLEKRLNYLLRHFELYQDWAYASRNHVFNHEDSTLLIWNRFFHKYGKSCEISELQRGTFSKENSRDSYKATPLKMITNLYASLGKVVTEDALRKRLNLAEKNLSLKKENLKIK